MGERIPLPAYGVSEVTTFSYGKRQDAMPLTPALLSFGPLGFAPSRLPVCGVYGGSVSLNSITRRVDAAPSRLRTQLVEVLDDCEGGSRAHLALAAEGVVLR